MPLGDLRSLALGLGVSVFRLGKGLYAPRPQRIMVCGTITTQALIGCSAVVVAPAVGGTVWAMLRTGAGRISVGCPVEEEVACGDLVR